MVDGTTVVVSGAGTGIGRAVALELIADGWHVTAVGRRREPLEQLAAEAVGDAVVVVDVVTADVATPAGAAAVADHVRSVGRPCAGVVANAGGASPTGTPSPPGAAGSGAAGLGVAGLDAVRGGWQVCFESNVLTAVLLVEALWPALVESHGRVVVLSSIAALRGSAGASPRVAGGGAYGAMKAALHAWMYDLAAGLGPYGGTANAVAPGFVPDTDFWADRLTEEGRALRVAQTLVGRAGTPMEIASLIGWLLGPDGGWMTGQVLSPNGGMVLGR